MGGSGLLPTGRKMFVPETELMKWNRAAHNEFGEEKFLPPVTNNRQ
jgi:hypothetical protein